MPTLLRCLVVFVCLVHFAVAESSPWNLDELKKTPQNITWGEKKGLVQEVYYQNEPFKGAPTRVFAYVGRPEGPGPFPAMVLVHGGGGQAFPHWAEHWAKRGYVAIAMDTAGNGPNADPKNPKLPKIRLPDGGPDQDHRSKFLPFTDETYRDVWTYHAVAAAIRGHSLLLSLPEVDRNRVGITGISWGGYLTCIITSLDDRLKVSVPVYGCGFLAESSTWKVPELDPMPADLRERWIKYFDPSSYLARVRCPILFINGTNDFAYPLDSYRKTYSLVRPELRNVCVLVRMAHGHIFTYAEVDRFVDAVLKDGPKPPRVGPVEVAGETAKVKVTQNEAVTSAEWNYTTDVGPWKERLWQTIPAEWVNGEATVKLPEGRPLIGYFSVVDSSGLRATSEHIDLAAPKTE